MQIATWIYVLGIWYALLDIAKFVLIVALVLGGAAGLVWLLQFVPR